MAKVGKKTPKAKKAPRTMIAGLRAWHDVTKITGPTYFLPMKQVHYRHSTRSIEASDGRLVVCVPLQEPDDAASRQLPDLPACEHDVLIPPKPLHKALAASRARKLKRTPAPVSWVEVDEGTIAAATTRPIDLMDLKFSATRPAGKYPPVPALVADLEKRTPVARVLLGAKLLHKLTSYLTSLPNGDDRIIEFKIFDETPALTAGMAGIAFKTTNHEPTVSGVIMPCSEPERKGD